MTDMNIAMNFNNDYFTLTYVQSMESLRKSLLILKALACLALYMYVFVGMLLLLANADGHCRVWFINLISQTQIIIFF